MVKLGGSLITNKLKPYTLNQPAIDRSVKEIGQARQEGDFDLLLGHGSGSFGHISAKKYQTAEGFIDQQSKYGFCLVQNDAASLNRIIVSALLKGKEPAFSIQTSACSLAKNSRIKEFYSKPIKILLKYNIIPVLYGDVGIEVKKGSCILSTEEIFNYLAKELNPQKIIMAGNTDGVYAEEKTVPEINKKNWLKIRKYLGGSSGIDVTGGMLHKVAKAIELAKLGINTQIINGGNPNNLKNCLLGKNSGTLVTW